MWPEKSRKPKQTRLKVTKIPAAVQTGVVQAVQQVVRLGAVPQTHQPECQEVAEVRAQIAALEPAALGGREHEPGVDVIAKPEGQAHVPAIPEVPNVARQKRPIEVLRAVDAEQVAQPDREGAV